MQIEEIETSSAYVSTTDFLESNSQCQGDTHCLCEADPYWAQLAGYDCREQQVMYCWSEAEVPQQAPAGWRAYHTDYPSAPLRTGIGNTEFITDLAGQRDPLKVKA